MSDEKLIGHGRCPVCGNGKARFTVSKKSLACMTCNACNIQIFARSDSSDEKLRACIKPAAEPVEVPPAPADVPAAIEVPPAAPVIKQKTGAGWGLLGSAHG